MTALEPGSSTVLSGFENGFEKEEKEIVVLLKDCCNGARFFEKNWLIPSVNFIASVDEATGEMIKEEGRIEWIIENAPSRKGWGYDFKQYGIYRLLVRKCFTKELSPFQSAFMNNRYMLIKILERDVSNDKLEEYKEYLSKPVLIETKYGDFELDRSLSWFSTDIELFGFDIFECLETDEDNGDTADGALQAFLKTAEDFEEFDKKVKESAAKNLLDLANDWLQDNDEAETDEITKEMFIDSIEISEMTVSPDGSITLYYDDGDMFWGHAIEISVEPDGTVSDANIAG